MGIGVSYAVTNVTANPARLKQPPSYCAISALVGLAVLAG
jgi:hypothetical protein